MDFDPNDIAQGFWDEAAQRLTVITTEVGPAAERASARAALGGVRVFTGYQFSTPQDQAPGQDLRWTLAGSFQASVAGAGASARRNVFGWFAHLTEVV